MPDLLSTATAVVISAGLVYPADDLRARVERSPKAVAAFVERRAMCNHFLGEEPYDEKRAAFLNRTIRELRCARLERDERRLRGTFRDRPAVLALLDETAESLGW